MQTFKLQHEKCAFLIDTRSPLFSNKQSAGEFECLSQEQSFFYASDLEIKDCLKHIISHSFQTIVLCGSDASLGEFVNTYRDLLPNPSRQHKICLVPMAKGDKFAIKHQFAYPSGLLGSIKNVDFTVTHTKLPELNGFLCPYISAGHDWQRMPNIEKLKLSLNASRLSSFFPSSLATSYNSLCINESAHAYQLEENLLLKDFEQEQVLFHNRILSLLVTASLTQLNLSTKGSLAQAVFQLRTKSLPKLQLKLNPLKRQSQTFLAQRVRFECSPEIDIRIPGLKKFSANHFTITLSQRDFHFLSPLRVQ